MHTHTHSHPMYHMCNIILWVFQLGKYGAIVTFLWIFMHYFSYITYEGEYKYPFFPSQIELVFGNDFVIIWQSHIQEITLFHSGKNKKTHKKRKSRQKKMDSNQAEGNWLLHVLSQLPFFFSFLFKSKLNTSNLDW